MRAFESPLGPLLESYISYRASLGYGEKGLRRILLAFDRYVCEQKAGLEDLNASFFLELKKTLQKKPGIFNAMLRSVRGFFAYLVRCQIVAENPLLDIESYAPKAFIPFVFSKEKTAALLCAAQAAIRKQDPDSFFRDYSAYLAIVLLARCAMRIKEPLRLKLADYQSTQKTIYIAKTKFGKDRLIPVPMAVAAQIDTYLNVREALVTDGNSYLFAGKGAKPLSVKNIYRLFDQSVKAIGIDRKRSTIRDMSFGSPTPHSLRHSFAINTLKAIKQRGGCPQNALPVLSAYLGHSKYRYTAVYLKVLDAEHRKALVDFAISRQEEI
jgi:site-specific recombinase XerD